MQLLFIHMYNYCILISLIVLETSRFFQLFWLTNTDISHMLSAFTIIIVIKFYFIYMENNLSCILMPIHKLVYIRMICSMRWKPRRWIDEAQISVTMNNDIDYLNITSYFCQNKSCKHSCNCYNVHFINWFI